MDDVGDDVAGQATGIFVVDEVGAGGRHQAIVDEIGKRRSSAGGDKWIVEHSPMGVSAWTSVVERATSWRRPRYGDQDCAREVIGRRVVGGQLIGSKVGRGRQEGGHGVLAGGLCSMARARPRTRGSRTMPTVFCGADLIVERFHGDGFMFVGWQQDVEEAVACLRTHL